MNETIVVFTGMTTLLLWGVFNVYVGWVNRKKDPGTPKYYRREMNGLWGIINTAIAVFALYSLITITAATSIDYVSIRDIVAINVIIDIGYILVGVILGFSPQFRTSIKRKGYGQAIMLQGAVLFVLDALLVSGLVLAA